MVPSSLKEKKKGKKDRGFYCPLIETTLSHVVNLKERMQQIFSLKLLPSGYEILGFFFFFQLIKIMTVLSAKCLLFSIARILVIIEML